LFAERDSTAVARADHHDTVNIGAQGHKVEIRSVGEIRMIPFAPGNVSIGNSS
jgi:hypothetical protein